MIKGLPLRLCEIGKIKIGGKGKLVKSKSGKEFRVPAKYDYFVVTTMEKDKDDNFIPDKSIMEKIGEKPRELKVRLLFDDIDLNFQTSYACYKGKKCFCHGDGETATRTAEKNENEKIQVPCDPTTCPYMIDGHCKVSGILSCLLPESGTLGGVHKFRTHSYNSIMNILGSLSFLQMASGGILMNLPLKLIMVDKQTEEHGTVKTVNLVFDGDVNLLTKAVSFESRRRNIGRIDVAQIEHQGRASGILDDTDDPEDVSDEFYTADEQVTETAGTTAEKVSEKIQEQTSEKTDQEKLMDLF